MRGMVETVHEKEDYTLRYLMTEKLEGDEPEFIMIETYVQPCLVEDHLDCHRLTHHYRYKDKASAEKHLTEIGRAHV